MMSKPDMTQGKPMKDSSFSSHDTKVREKLTRAGLNWKKPELLPILIQEEEDYV